MNVHGCDCSLLIKTVYAEELIPFENETIREGVSLLKEKAAIEGDGICKGIVKNNGVSGCIKTPLKIGVAPLLFFICFGKASKPVYVSGSGNIRGYFIDLLPLDETENFDLIQDRGAGKILFGGCKVRSFELRFMREETITLKMDIRGNESGKIDNSDSNKEYDNGERFSGDNVTYYVNSEERKNIYGITLIVNKDDGLKTEVWVKRAIEDKADEQRIDRLTVIASLYDRNDEYGIVRITLNNLVMLSDETQVNTVETVIGLVRYYAAGNVTAEVFTNAEAVL